MTLAVRLQAGLPVVPRPVPGELLGSWLLRVAGFYGIGLDSLLVRLEAAPPTGRESRHWHRLHQRHLDMHKLALAVHQSADAVSAMSPVQCSRYWPAEVGFCGLCLQEQALSLGAVGWLRQWMHPMALACRRHQAWLQPVSIKRLAGITDASEFERLSRRSPRRLTLELKRETEIIGSALWLEDLVVRPDEHIPPWGPVDQEELAEILLGLMSIVVAPRSANIVRHQLSRSPGDCPELGQKWDIQRFKVDDGQGMVVNVDAPSRLRHRQLVLGLIADYLRVPAARRNPREPIAKLIAGGLPAWQLARWPTAVLQWVWPAMSAGSLWHTRRHSAHRRRATSPLPLFGI